MKNTLDFNNLQKSTNIFIQLNLLKGYELLDKSGAIINLFYKENKSPVFHMDQNGLVIVEPAIGIQTMTINIQNQSIQAALFSDGNFNSVIEEFTKKAKAITDVLGVELVMRIGLRTNFTHYFEREEDFRNYFEERIKIKDFINASIVLKTKINDDYLAKIRIVPIENNADSKKGVLFDIDIYLEKEESVLEAQNNFKAMYSGLEQTVRKYV
jgi:hypothetical protein